MGTKSNKSSTDSTKKTLLLRDFVVDEDDQFVFSEGDSKYEIVFFEGYVARPKRFIQVWYIEENKKYLKEESIMDWNILKYRWQIDERNRKFWDKINNFYQEYFNE